MKIEGGRGINHPIELVYTAATDLKGLASDFAQVSEVQLLASGGYRITIQLDFGIYTGAYYADLYVEDENPPSSFSIRGLHSSKLGGLSLKCMAYLISEESCSTHISIIGDFKMTGMMRFANKTVVRKGISFGVGLMLDTVEKRVHLYQ